MPAALRSAGTQTKAAQRLPGGCPASPPRRPRAGAARDGREGAAALGALLGGGNASLAGLPQAPRPPHPAARSDWRRGARRAEGWSLCHARRAPGSQWVGRENAGSTRGPRVPRHGLSITRQSLAPPLFSAAPPGGGSAGSAPLGHGAPRCEPGPRRHCCCFVPGLGCEGVAAALGRLTCGLSPAVSAASAKPVRPGPLGMPAVRALLPAPSPGGGREAEPAWPPPAAFICRGRAGGGTGEHLVVRYAL